MSQDTCIDWMAPRGSNPRDTCFVIPECGALTETVDAATLNNPLSEVVRKINVGDKGVYWGPRITLSYRPIIGMFNCTPEIDSINSLTPVKRCGKMVIPGTGPDSSAYFPVRNKVRLSNFIDPKYSLRAALSIRYLAQVWERSEEGDTRWILA